MGKVARLECAVRVLGVVFGVVGVARAAVALRRMRAVNFMVADLVGCLQKC